MRFLPQALTAIAFSFATVLHAWGPHSEIAQAALDALGPGDPLVKHLGPDAARLAQYVWMADQRQQLLVRKDEVFYADDYLLFPAATRHYDHLCPEVKQTYAPYFRRALQALRTESPRNASRWIGSLLHFTTDTGSPPHSAEIRGPVHSKMENWVNGKLIHIPDYKPLLLGATDDEAEAGFLKRMDGLIVYCKERAERCRADVEADRRELVEPVVLEAALETARVTADLLHTLGVLAAKPGGDAALSGKVLTSTLPHPSLSRLPVKITLLGTLYSTLTEPDGTFTFRSLPAGSYQVTASAPGIMSPALTVALAPKASQIIPEIDLTHPLVSGNLLRNATFSLQWLAPGMLDQWSQPKRPGKLLAAKPVSEWNGEWIPLETGVTYQLSARWKSSGVSDAETEIFLRPKAKADPNTLPAEVAAINASSPKSTLVASGETAWVQVCVRGALPPAEVLEVVSLSSTIAP